MRKRLLLRLVWVQNLCVLSLFYSLKNAQNIELKMSGTPFERLDLSVLSISTTPSSCARTFACLSLYLGLDITGSGLGPQTGKKQSKSNCKNLQFLNLTIIAKASSPNLVR